MKYNYKLVIKKSNTAGWASSAYIPLEGEPCYDTEEKTLKIGDGINTFVNLVGISGGFLDNSEGSTETANSDDYLLKVLKGAANGLAELGSDMKVPSYQLKVIDDLYPSYESTYSSNKINNMITSGVSYRGHWNPVLNEPRLINAEGTNGHYYIASEDGDINLGSGVISFLKGDNVIYSSDNEAWEKSINSNKVLSVNTKEGIITLDSTDLIIGNYDNVSEYEPISSSNTISVALAKLESGVVNLTNSAEKSQLELITNASVVGYRILGRDVNNYGTIGSDAVDFSYGTGSNSGATGERSFALGYGVRASGANSMALGNNTTAQNTESLAMGSYNIGTSPDTVLEIGVGADSSNKANALEVLKSGVIMAPELSIDKVTELKTLVTKEYLDDPVSNIDGDINGGSF
jgi:hypothetical protein